MRKKLSENAILTFGMKMTMKKTGSVVLLALLSGLSALILVLTVFFMNMNNSTVSDYSEAGNILYYVMAVIHMLLGVFIAPAVAGTAISSEREKQTIDLLLCSQMMPWDVIKGKYLSSISWILLITVSLLPSYSVIYMIGGVPAKAIFFTVLYIMWLTSAVATFAIFFSSVCKRSAVAVVMTYITLFGIVSVNFSLFAGYYGILTMAQNAYALNFGSPTPFDWYNEFISPVAWFNPLIGYICILVGSTTGVSEIADILFGVMTSNPGLDTALIISVNVVFYTLLGYGLLRLAARSIDPLRVPRSDRKFKKKYGASQTAEKSGSS